MALSQFSKYLDRFGSPVTRDSLAVDSHRQEDYHLIDESLAPDPGILNPSAGESPYPARADHGHAYLDPPVIIEGGTDVNASGNGFLILGDYGVTPSLHFDNNEIQAFDAAGNGSNLNLNIADPSLVQVGSDLTLLNSGVLTFSPNTSGTKILLYDPLYHLDIETSTLAYYSGRFHTFNGANNSTLRFDPAGSNFLQLDGATGLRPYVSFYINGTRYGYVGYPNPSGNTMSLSVDNGPLILNATHFDLPFAIMSGNSSSDLNIYTKGSARHIFIDNRSSPLGGVYLRINSSTKLLVSSAGIDFLDHVYSNFNINCNDVYGVWFRSNGDTGWYNQTHGIGINATDVDWVRVYSGLGFLGQHAGPLPASGSTSGMQTVMRDTSLGLYWRLTSSIAYKDNVSDLAPVGKIIDSLRPVRFTDKISEDDSDDIKDWKAKDWTTGFIAEEVAPIEDGMLATFEVDKGNLVAGGWRLPDMIAVLVKEVQDLRKRLAVLEA